MVRSMFARACVSPIHAVFAVAFVMSIWLLVNRRVSAEETAAGNSLASQRLTDDTEQQRPKLPPPKNAKPLAKGEEFSVWVDGKKGVIYIDGEVSLREGPLEMFACQRNTKEHESVVAVDTLAFPVHAALLALGAEPGGPVQFEPEFVPPSGTEIEITVDWLDKDNKWQSARAQDWVRDVKTGLAMAHPWVFAGSLFWTDPQTGRQHYTAEAGDFICVSNFATATLDVPIESTQTNEGLFFEAFTEHIPPLGTPVRLTLKPILNDDNLDARPNEPPAPE